MITSDWISDNIGVCKQWPSNSIIPSTFIGWCSSVGNPPIPFPILSSLSIFLSHFWISPQTQILFLLKISCVIIHHYDFLEILKLCKMCPIMALQPSSYVFWDDPLVFKKYIHPYFLVKQDVLHLLYDFTMKAWDQTLPQEALCFLSGEWYLEMVFSGELQACFLLLGYYGF